MMDHFFGAMYVFHPQGPKITGSCKSKNSKPSWKGGAFQEIFQGPKKNMLAKDTPRTSRVLKYLVSSGDKN